MRKRVGGLRNAKRFAEAVRTIQGSGEDRHHGGAEPVLPKVEPPLGNPNSGAGGSHELPAGSFGCGAASSSSGRHSIPSGQNQGRESPFWPPSDINLDKENIYAYTRRILQGSSLMGGQEFQVTQEQAGMVVMRAKMQIALSLMDLTLAASFFRRRSRTPGRKLTLIARPD